MAFDGSKLLNDVADISLVNLSMMDTSLLSASTVGISDPPIGNNGFGSSVVGDLIGSKYSAKVLSLAN